MKQGIVFALLVCCAFASYAAGQRSESDQCADYQLALPVYYTCIIKCHQFVLGFDDSTADFCTSKFRLTKAKKNNYNNGDVVNTLKCIALKCKQFVPDDICEDSSLVEIGSSTEFSDFSTAFSTTSYEDGTISETSTSAPSSSEIAIEDLASFSESVFTSESTTTASSFSDTKTTSSSLSSDNSIISTTSSPPMDDILRTVRSNDEEPSSDAEECEEDDGGKTDGSFSDATTTTASYSDATATSFASTDSTSYFIDEDCVSDFSSPEGGYTPTDGSAENGEYEDFSASAASTDSGRDGFSASSDSGFDATATSQTGQSSAQPSQNISRPYGDTVSTDSPDSYFSKSLGGIFNDDMTPNDKTPGRNFNTGNRHRNYASSEAGAAQDGSGSYAFSNSGFGNNNPQFPPNPNWIPSGFDYPQAPLYNPQQGLAPGFQQGLAPGPQQIPVYNPPPRPPFNRRQRKVYGPRQRQLINPQQGLVNNPQQGPVYNPLQSPDSGINGNFPQQSRRKVIRRKKGAFPTYNQGNQIYGGNEENINNNRFQENTGRVPPANNGGIRRIPPNLAVN